MLLVHYDTRQRQLQLLAESSLFSFLSRVSILLLTRDIDIQ